MDTGPSEMRPIFIGITLLGPVPMLIIISKDFPYSKLIEDFYSEFAIKNFE